MIINSQINPRISVAKVNISNGDPMSPTTLKELLEYSLTLPVRTVYPEGDKRRDAEKRKDLWATAYTNGVRLGTGSDFDSDGALFIDIDHIDRELSDIIFNDFDSLCEFLPCILAVVYSYSYGLHFFAYEPRVKEDSSKYTKYQTLYMCAIAEWANLKHNANFTVEDGNLDLHNSKIYQGLYFLNRPYKFNDYCVHIPDKSIKQLENFAKKYKLDEESPKNPITNVISIPLDQLKANGKIHLDSDTEEICGMNGNNLRYLTVATAYVHFNTDINKTSEYILNTFDQYTSNRMLSSLKSQIRTGRVYEHYSNPLECYWFGAESLTDKVTHLAQNQYLSDVLKFEDIKSKYTLIKSNTNTGKTEWIKKILKENPNVLVAQPNKALRDGKKQGIEDFYKANFGAEWSNLQKELPNRVFTTIDGIEKHYKSLEGYTLILDECHLLEQYSSFRTETIRKFIGLMESADKLIFLSATPSSEVGLFEGMEVLEFIKEQQQILNIELQGIKFTGKGSKNAARYQHLVSLVEKYSQQTKIVIFSNKKQEEWKKYGLSEMENVTYFNSKNYKNPAVQAILNENKLVNQVTLATCYMGCGVEIKNEEKILFMFDLDEGMDFNFINQSIGRARDAKEINVLMFDSGLKGSPINKTLIEEAFENFSKYEEGHHLLNIYAAGKVGLYDVMLPTYKEWPLVRKLAFGALSRQRQHFGISGNEALKNLPYAKVNINELPVVELKTDGRKSITRREKKAEQVILEMNVEERNRWFENASDERTYNRALNQLPYKDPVLVSKVIEKVLFILKFPTMMRNYNITDVFGTLDKAYSNFKKLRDACDYWAGNSYIAPLKHGKQEEVDKKYNEIEYVKLVFSKEYIEYVTNWRKAGGVELSSMEFDLDVFNPQSVVLDRNFKGEILDPDFKAAGKVNRKKLNCALASKGGKKTQTISIKNIETGEIMNFASKGECMEWIGCSSATFSTFLKGGSKKLNKKYQVLSGC